MFGGKMTLLLIQLICYFASITFIDSQSCTTPVKVSPSALFLFNNHNYVISQNHSSPNQVVVLNLPTDFDGLPTTQYKGIRTSSNLRFSPTAAVAVTSSLILVFAGDQMSLCALPTNSLNCVQLFNVSLFFESINPATKIRAATRNATSLILIIEEPDLKVWHRSYSVQLNTNGKYDLTGGHEYIGQTTLPSAITAVNDTYAEYIVVFDDFWTTFTAQQLETPVKLDIKSNNQIRLARTFSGCPVDLCFEGDLDAAGIAVDGIDIYLFRGAYQWNLTSFSSKTKLPFPREFFQVDAAFSISSIDYLVINNMVHGYANNNIVYTKTAEESFIGYSGQIDAAYSSNGMVHLLSGQTYTSYMYTQLTKSFGDIIDDKRMDNKWPGIPNDIDAAVELPASQEVILFKGSFHYRASTSGGIVVPQLNMNTLYQCEDSIYFDLSQSIGISSFNEFKDYITKFCPGSNCRLSDSESVKTTSSTKLVVILMAVIIIVIALALVAWYIVRKKPSFKKADSVVEVMFEDNNTTMQSTATNIDVWNANTTQSKV